MVPACLDLQFTSMALFLRHWREAHAMYEAIGKSFFCPYEGCEKGVSGNGITSPIRLRTHMIRIHKWTSSTSREVVIPPVPDELLGPADSFRGEGSEAGNMANPQDHVDTLPNQYTSFLQGIPSTSGSEATKYVE